MKAAIVYVTKKIVRLAYRLFLDRDASDEEIAMKVRNHTTLSSLRRVFINSAEFNAKFKHQPTDKSGGKRADQILIHLHIPKTAGSSLTRILAPNYAAGTKMTLSDIKRNRLRQLSPPQRQNLHFLFGHLSHGVARHLPQDHLYICVLRRPGPRLLSFYNYLYRTESHPSQKIVGGQRMSFGVFLEWTADPGNGHRGEVDNGEVRRLGGLGMRQKYGQEADLLPRALSNILAPDMIYGLTEHFDDFVERLFVRGIIPNEVSARENAAPYPVDLDKELANLTVDQRMIYDSFTHWDQIFYDICKSIYFATGEPERTRWQGLDDATRQGDQMKGVIH